MENILRLMDVENLDLIFLSPYNPKNTLLVFPHDSIFHVYHVDIKSDTISLAELKKGIINPLEFEVISHETDNKISLSKYLNQDGSMGALVVLEKNPTNNPLDYKLNLYAAAYLLGKESVAVPNPAVLKTRLH